MPKSVKQQKQELLMSILEESMELREKMIVCGSSPIEWKYAICEEKLRVLIRSKL